jgi:hypothetical protein
VLVFKITLAISGDDFFPSKLIQSVSNKYVAESFHDADGDLTHGVIFYMHPQLFGIQGEGVDYEEWFVELLEKNFEAFKKYGAEDIELFIEVYYSDDQCNFEIFNKSMLKRMGNFHISIPISVYHLSEKEVLNLLDGKALR